MTQAFVSGYVGISPYLIYSLPNSILSIIKDILNKKQLYHPQRIFSKKKLLMLLDVFPWHEGNKDRSCLGVDPRSDRQGFLYSQLQ